MLFQGAYQILREAAVFVNMGFLRKAAGQCPFLPGFHHMGFIAGLGMLVGILAAKHQFRANEGRELFEKN
jgi:hypothetical protein